MQVEGVGHPRKRKRWHDICGTAEKFIDAAPLTEGDLAVSSTRGTIGMSTEESKTDAGGVSGYRTPGSSGS